MYAGSYCVSFAAFVLSASAAACAVTSPAHSVAVVELYTSQGCSSCPPADRWLSTLPSRFHADRVIPLALHVGYWDYIGWKDPFARREFNARQSELAAANRSRSVYTPGVFVQGRETPRWHDVRAFQAAVQAANAVPPAAAIDLSARLEGNTLDVTANVTGALRQPRITLALAQSGLSTAVTAGENRGEKLANDHVAREWRVLPGPSATTRLMLPTNAAPSRLNLVAWVQDGDSPAPVQAVSLPLGQCGR
jgi:hypothetical protein